MSSPYNRKHYEAMAEALVENTIMALHAEGKSDREIAEILTVRQNRMPGPTATTGIVRQVIAGYENAEAARAAQEKAEGG